MTPLKGIKVLDLTRILAGPWATMTLADLGAEVWKIEQPGGGDDTRRWAPPSVDGIATYYLAVNRNKKSVAIDLAAPGGREIVLALARKADVVVENFRPASLRKLGLDYRALSEVNPRLIHCSISGYGRDTPFADRPGYDFILQAECGFMAITGETDGQPMRLGVAFIDLVTGMNVVQAVLAALYAREHDGVGCHIDIALFDSGLHFLANVASGYLNTGTNPKRFGNAHPSIVPYQLFDCSDGPIAVAVGNDEQYQRLCRLVLDVPALAEDERFRTNESRTNNRSELIPLLREAFAARTVAAVVEAMGRAGIPVGRVQSVEEAFRSEMAQARDVVLASAHPSIGEVRTVRSPLRFSGSPKPSASAPPLLGQHTREILQEVLGYSAADIDRLIAERAAAEAVHEAVQPSAS